MTRANLLVRSMIGSVGGRAGVLIAPFLVMPAMLNYLGVRDFGIWMTAIAITGFIQFADLGVGAGLLTRLPAAYAREDMSAIRSYVASSFAALGIVALILSSTGLIFLIFLADWLPPIYSVILITFSLSIPGSIIYRILYATNRIVLANIWQVGGAFLSIGVAFTAIHMAWSAVAVVFAYAMVAPLTMITCTCWTMWREVAIRPKAADIEMVVTLDLMGLGWKFFILAILTAAAMNVDNIIIALRLGEAAVTAYAVPARIGTLLLMIVWTVATPLWTIYSNALSSGERAWVWRNALLMAALGLMGVIAAGAILTFGIDLVMRLWMGRSFSDQHKIIAGITAFSAILALTAPFTMILNAAGRIKQQIVAWTVFVPIAFGAKWALLPLLGTWTLPLVDAVAYALIMSVPFFMLARNVIHVDQAIDQPDAGVA